jgi:hypothetical protein
MKQIYDKRRHMMKSKMSAIGLVALGILFVVCAVGKLSSGWEWWPLLLLLSGMAFLVGLVLFLVRGIVNKLSAGS